jgi:hypothetical protein
MTEKEFVIWLHGFLEISGATSLDEKQLQVIKDHLNTFFTKVTPTREKKKDDDHVAKQIEDLRKLAEEWKEQNRQPVYPPLNWPTIPQYPNPPWQPDVIYCSKDSTADFQENSSKTYC